MNRSQELILLLEMSVEQAFDILGINPKTYKTSDLKDIYRKASLKHHPDRGGDVEMMKKVNLAYGKLKDTKACSVSIKLDKDKEKQDHILKVKLIKRFFRNAFNPEVYKKYFEEVSGFKFEYSEDEKFLPYGVYGALSIAFEFVTQDSDTVFKFTFQVNLGDVEFTKTLGDGDATFPYFVDHYVYHANRQQKMKKQKWSAQSSVSTLVNPEKLFPKATLKKIFGGKKQRKFSKRDFIEGVKRGLKGELDKADLWVPLKDDLKLLLTRFAYKKMTPTWTPIGIYGHNKRIEELKDAFLFEDEATLGFLIKLVNQMKKKSSTKDMTNFFNTEVKKYMDKFK